MLVNRTLNNNEWESHYNRYQNYFYHIGLDGAKQLGHKQDLLVIKCKVGTKHAFRLYWHSCSEFGTTHYFPAPKYFNCYILDFFNASFDTPWSQLIWFCTWIILNVKITQRLNPTVYAFSYTKETLLMMRICTL